MDINNEFWVTEIQRIAKLGYYIYDIKRNIWTTSEVLDEIFGIDNSYVKDFEGWLNIIHCDYRNDMSFYVNELLINVGKQFDADVVEIFISAILKNS